MASWRLFFPRADWLPPACRTTPGCQPLPSELICPWVMSSGCKRPRNPFARLTSWVGLMLLAKALEAIESLQNATASILLVLLRRRQPLDVGVPIADEISFQF